MGDTDKLGRNRPSKHLRSGLRKKFIILDHADEMTILGIANNDLLRVEGLIEINKFDIIPAAINGILICIASAVFISTKWLLFSIVPMARNVKGLSESAKNVDLEHGMRKH